MSPNVALTARHLRQRYETQTRQSGEVGFALAKLGDAGADMRAVLQATEHAMRVAKSKWDAVGLAQRAAREGRDAVQVRFEALCEALVFACEAHGPSEARTVLDARTGDGAAIAQNLAQLVQHVPHVGPGLAMWITHLGKELTTAEKELTTANDGVDKASREFAAALLKSASNVVQARALRVAMGTLAAPTRKPRPRTKRVTAAQPAVPAPVLSVPAVTAEQWRSLEVIEAAPRTSGLPRAARAPAARAAAAEGRGARA